MVTSMQHQVFGTHDTNWGLGRNEFGGFKSRILIINQNQSGVFEVRDAAKGVPRT